MKEKIKAFFPKGLLDVSEGTKDKTAFILAYKMLHKNASHFTTALEKLGIPLKNGKAAVTYDTASQIASCMKNLDIKLCCFLSEQYQTKITSEPQPHGMFIKISSDKAYKSFIEWLNNIPPLKLNAYFKNPKDQENLFNIVNLPVGTKGGVVAVSKLFAEQLIPMFNDTRLFAKKATRQITPTIKKIHSTSVTNKAEIIINKYLPNRFKSFKFSEQGTARFSLNMHNKHATIIRSILSSNTVSTKSDYSFKSTLGILSAPQSRLTSIFSFNPKNNQITVKKEKITLFCEWMKCQLKNRKTSVKQPAPDLSVIFPEGLIKDLKRREDNSKVIIAINTQHRLAKVFESVCEDTPIKMAITMEKAKYEVAFNKDKLNDFVTSFNQKLSANADSTLKRPRMGTPQPAKKPKLTSLALLNLFSQEPGIPSKKRSLEHSSDPECKKAKTMTFQEDPLVKLIRLKDGRLKIVVHRAHNDLRIFSDVFGYIGAKVDQRSYKNAISTVIDHGLLSFIQEIFNTAERPAATMGFDPQPALIPEGSSSETSDLSVASFIRALTD